MTNNKGNVLLAFLAGGVVGAGIALLYAPASGADTRKRIKEGADGAKDWAKERLDAVSGGLEERTGMVKQMIGNKTEDLKAAYTAGKEAFYKGRERLEKESS
ncbi:MAG: YtxH domain-containing protein [Deltaproteobacteria bacterium]|nr:YtxH domain-containing protein [Deltaproteobacteria bacterium]